jgi:hypothetical protein
MKLTVIRDQQGQFVGAVHGHIPTQPPAKAASGDQAGLVAHSGQSFEHVTVPEDFAEIKSDPDAFVRRLKEHLARLGKNYAD